MKSIPIVLVLLLFGQLIAADPVDVNDTDAVAARLIEVMDIGIPDGDALYLDIDGGPFTEAIYEQLAKHFMQSGVTVLNRATDDCLVLQIRHIGFDFADDEAADTIKFMVDLSGNDTGELLSISSVSFEVANAVDEEESSEMSWYDPIIITTIVGGLIYVFYYGNQ